MKTTTRAETQRQRVRMAAAHHGWNATDLHKRLIVVYPVHYETIRRIFSDERRSELEHDLIDGISEVTGFDVDFINGNAALHNVDTRPEVPQWAGRPIEIFAVQGRLKAA